MLSACTDDFLDRWGGDVTFPEGETAVTLSLDFSPFSASGNAAESRSLPGKTMDKLDDLCLVAYNEDGELIDGFPIRITAEKHNLIVTDRERPNSAASNGSTAEAFTKHGEFKVVLPYGRYYLYGLANLGRRDAGGNLEVSTWEVLNGSLADVIKDRETLLNHKVDWDLKNPLNNFEMLGFFTNNEQSYSPSTGTDTNNTQVFIDKPGVSLHSWLRRCATKVTVDFDGSELRENVKIFIKKVTIHDIPRQCALGMPNAPSDRESELYSFKDGNNRPLTTEGSDFIAYGSGSDHEQWPYISKGRKSLPDETGNPVDRHNENAESLFLYENMQGESTEERDKEQAPAPDGTVVGADTDKKDNVPCGSYIEVEAYYEMTSKLEVSEGTIIYRFMLGKDALKDFNVERNYHLKLTMCPRGNGNDVDWHIEYDRKSGFEWKDPYYVSYLYNHDSTLHFRYTPEGGKDIKTLIVDIVANNWWPDDKYGVLTTAVNEQNPLTPQEEADPLHASFSRNKYPDNDPDGLGGRTKYLGNGFLSLRATELTTLTFEQTSKDTDKSGWSTREYNKYMNDRRFYGVAEGDSIDQGRRIYYFKNGQPDPNDPSNKGREQYEIKQNLDGSLIFNIPVFTRAKNLVKETGYSGNSSYEGCRRSAYLRVKAILEDGSEESVIMRVIQVPRIVNPKGIYRRSGNNEDFFVELCELTASGSSLFKTIASDGPWMAEVLGDANFITLNGRQTINGATGSPVSFNVNFNKMNRDNKVRNAIIRVRYHNQTCVHLIFVRQGYSSQSLYPGGTEWHTCNYIYDGVEADDPRDEGSLFKYGNTTQPIDASCNIFSLPPNVLPTVSDFHPAPANGIVLATATGNKGASVSWSDIKGNMYAGWGSNNIASVNDFRRLYNSNLNNDGKNIDPIEHGYGVLYADGATRVAKNVIDAYEYSRYGDKAERDKKGMRGVFVYYYNHNNVKDPYNTKSVFFPIGMAGYGHRRANDGVTGSSKDSHDGTLRYTTGRNAPMPTGDLWMPQLYDIYRCNGAIYWADRDVWSVEEVNGSTSTVDPYLGLDLNYFTFDVNIITHLNLQKHSLWTGCSDADCIDAIFLRGVGKQTKTSADSYANKTFN